MVKNKIKGLFRSMGLELRRYNARSSPSMQISGAIKHCGTNILFDVGANKGQFACELREAGYADKIVSFEPLTSAYEELKNKAQKDAKWFIHDRVALGASSGEVKINIAGNSASSSVLPMLTTHSNIAPKSSYIGQETVPVITLDSVIADYCSEQSRPFLKIDTQGFEWEVLDGAEELLGQAYGVLLELSLVPLYEGQAMWLRLIQRMEEAGFMVWALIPGLTDPVTGQTFQVDGVFVRE